MNPEIVNPNPTRVIEGLRDTGYNLNTAVADIIDNSIAAEATLIEVISQMDYEGNITVYIADNGYGMDRDDLLNAMKYGSDRRNNPCSLGKFGLGLKTASTAFCRSLSVISRSSSDDSLLKARWDLDHVAEVEKWELLFPEVDEQEKRIIQNITEGGSGTLVVWEKVDRILKDYKDPSGHYATQALEKTFNDELYNHIAMVYERFLDKKDNRARNISIKVNDKKVVPWDPFCKEEESTELVADEFAEVELPDGSETSFLVKAYVLPRREEFSNDKSAKRADISNDNQGFYIYRENRLIHYADWLRMYQKEPHGSLLRIEFSFDHTLDEAFNVDIKKSKINLNDELYNWLKDIFLPAPRRAANERYRNGRSSKVKQKSKGAHDNSNTSIKNKEKGLRLSDVEVKDEDKNEVEVKNKKGTFKIKMSVSKALKDGEVIIQPVNGLRDGILWEPCIIEQHHGIKINTNHQFYHKVYLPNYNSSVTIQGIDSLLWALCEAELGIYNDETKDHFEELRYEVSRLLRKLVLELPEPNLDDHDD